GAGGDGFIAQGRRVFAAGVGVRAAGGAGRPGGGRARAARRNGFADDLGRSGRGGGEGGEQGEAGPGAEKRGSGKHRVSDPEGLFPRRTGRPARWGRSYGEARPLRSDAATHATAALGDASRCIDLQRVARRTSFVEYSPHAGAFGILRPLRTGAEGPVHEPRASGGGTGGRQVARRAVGLGGGHPLGAQSRTADPSGGG